MGPAMIEGYSSTLWVAPGWRAERDEPGNIIMQKV
jgi:N-methylhydantoinase A